MRLEESDLVLACPFCGVSHVLVTNQLHRFCLPLKLTVGQPLWVPYLHFKGSAFWLHDGDVTQRVLHVSAPGAPDPRLPPSLGFRSQTQRLRYVSPASPGSFVRFSLTPSQILAGALSSARAEMDARPAYVGETASLIYLPLVATREAVFDGVSGQRLERPPQLETLRLARAPSADVRFLPALCPECGANLAADPHAVALPCANCHRVWEPIGGRFRPAVCETWHTHTGRYVYLPFWRFRILEHGPTTCGELAQLTGQPWPARQPSGRAWQFWCPAFKIRPRLLLRLCERLSLCEVPGRLRPDLPRRHRHPITLPSREAGEMLPIVLASLAFDVKARPGLFRARPRLEDPQVVYLPFRDAGQDLTNDAMSLSVSRSALGFGAGL